MNPQTSLPFVRGSDTSRAAAESVRESAQSIRERVYGYIVWCDEEAQWWPSLAPGATADEIERGLGISGNTVRPRLVELRKQGRIVATDARRRTRSGRLATVYRTQ